MEEDIYESVSIPLTRINTCLEGIHGVEERINNEGPPQVIGGESFFTPQNFITSGPTPSTITTR